MSPFHSGIPSRQIPRRSCSYCCGVLAGVATLLTASHDLFLCFAFIGLGLHFGWGSLLLLFHDSLRRLFGFRIISRCGTVQVPLFGFMSLTYANTVLMSMMGFSFIVLRQRLDTERYIRPDGFGDYGHWERRFPQTTSFYACG